MNVKRMARALEKVVKKEMKNGQPWEMKVPRFSTSIKFRPIECKDLPQPFKQEFINNGRLARLIKYNFGYEIRYIRNGYHIVAFNADLAAAKREFLKGVSA